MADKYIIRVTAGSGYDVGEHVVVPVNTAEPVRISSALADVELNVRVQNYRGLPRNSPASSPYFDQEPHEYNGDQYSIAFRFTPKKPAKAVADGDSGEKDDDEEEEAEGISATDLQFGNDFDHPIRDRLPPGFGTAMNIVRWWIDPGLEGDAYADEPYLYGPALSSFNAVHWGAGEVDAAKGGLWFGEGGSESGLAARRDTGAPDDAKARMKWALKPDSKRRWVWRYGDTYALDFFNPYVDFNEFALRLPGFHLPIIRYWDGQSLRSQPKRSHQLRYVLRNRSTGAVYLAVLFTLYLKEDVNEDGSLKPAALQNKGGHEKKEGGVDDDDEEGNGHDEDFDEEKALAEARRKLSGVDLDAGPETNEDDVD
ncbi:hypothetical protein B0T26DRAFT_648935 [Lasiosphaeria miniovina]|uniref:Domain of unknown function at the cortex 1 domain-containing protein n=1 Tax=Lasiosphaeria miniovina TaxID=1954250 RepID=A0AA40DRG2_9PEZI|nr:uncharacterized protein B0T26DRAFT_648935 [Lasiosphaeria miniovina]KAK0712835.1 hypothetical protein B0T26DRAFT_648935 [Lasiosphaeria miniovina]